MRLSRYGRLRGNTTMDNINIDSYLEELDSKTLDTISKKIEVIKQQRQESKCEEIKDELNALFNPIKYMLEELNDNGLLGDCTYLLGNYFVVLDDNGTKYIDLKY